MKNSLNLEKWQRFYANRCKIHEGGYEKLPVNCFCQTMAQIGSYIEYIIPEEYQNYELDDFTGMKNGKSLIKQDIVQKARSELISYCWQGIEDGEAFDVTTWFPRSIMNRRQHNGESIIIYGNPWASINVDGIKTFKQPIGRTMLAAIVMKEAIRLRAYEGHGADKYRWVSFHYLCDRLMEQRSQQQNNTLSDQIYNEEIDDELIDYETADWLCVDGFESVSQSDAKRLFKSECLDIFFHNRLKRGFPNILVFQDDLSQEYFDLCREFGQSINSICNNRKTTRVRLLGNNKR